jgi:hypothetical protein
VDQPVKGRRPGRSVMEMPTIRLGMGLQELGRRQSDAKPEQPSPIPAESPGAGCSRPAGLAPAAPGGGVDAGPRRPGQGQGPPQAVLQGRHAPLTRPARGVGSAGWPRQRPLRVRVQGPGRGVGTAGEAVPGPRSSGPARFIGTCLVVFGGPCRNALWTRPRTQQAVPGTPSRAKETMVGDGKMAPCLTLSLRSTWPASPRAGPSRGAVAAGRGGPAGQPGPPRPRRSHPAPPQRRGRGAGGGRRRPGRADP